MLSHRRLSLYHCVYVLFSSLYIHSIFTRCECSLATPTMGNDRGPFIVHFRDYWRGWLDTNDNRHHKHRRDLWPRQFVCQSFPNPGYIPNYFMCLLMFRTTTYNYITGIWLLASSAGAAFASLLLSCLLAQRSLGHMLSIDCGNGHTHSQPLWARL